MTYGTVNADVISTSTSGGVLGAGNASAMKNRIINGAMVIDQRNSGASVTPAAGDVYTLDRWLSAASVSSKFSVQQNAGSVTPPVGFVNYLGATSLSAYSIPSGDLCTLQQKIEGYNVADLNWGSANAKTVTLSFWVRSSLTGTFGGALTNSAIDRSYPFAYSINAANTWEQKSITIVGDTSGTWLTTNGIGIRVYFGLGVGSTYSGTAGSWAGALYLSATGATSVVGTNGATFYITGVQLEVGSSATGFEYRQYTTELQLCQRYYWQTTAPASCAVSTGVNYLTTLALHYIKYPIKMRASPTFVYSSLADFYYVSNTNNTPTSLSAGAVGLDCARLDIGASGLSAVGASILQGQTGTGYIGFSSEL